MSSLRTLVIIGPTGAGKSTSGKWLAKQLGRTFIDLDEFIEQQTGVRIAEIFEHEGEAGFRERETRALLQCLHKDNVVIASGAGAVLSEQNRDALRTESLVLYLHISTDLQLRRLRVDNKRPLLQTPNRREKLMEMAEIRTPLYQQCAHLYVNVGEHPLSKLRGHMLNLVREFLTQNEQSTCPN